MRLPLEKLSGWESRGGGGETMEEPNEEEKIGDGINGGKPLEDNGNGEVIGTVVGDCRGEAEKKLLNIGTTLFSKNELAN